MDQIITESAHVELPRDVSALETLFEFVRERCAQLQLDASVVSRSELVAEELFTNLVKYNPEGQDPIELSAGGHVDDPRALVMRFVDRGVHEFDPRDAPSVDTSAPLEDRRPGGLGLHLVRRMVDSLDYEHENGDSITTVILRPRRNDAEDRGA